MKTGSIKAVLFDFDGTLTVPGLIDFMAIKKEINCPRATPILEFIAALPSGGERRRGAKVLERYENNAVAAAKPNENAAEIIMFLRGKGLKLGILTRNRRRSVLTSLKSFRKIGRKHFDVIVTREHELKLKPHPEGVLFAARVFGVLPREMAVIGDYVFDIEAGREAGALTVFLESNHTTRRPDPPADFTIKRLDELKQIFGNK
ncbi:MAG: HAD family phosphatase [Kiritimatiellia bacterium]|nr:HAD family phosphatase [Kiritimatiellia bacterium]